MSLYLAWSVLVLEHALLLLKLLLAHLVPDTPRWVEREQAKRHYTRAAGGFRVARSAKELDEARRSAAGPLPARVGAAPSGALGVASGARPRASASAMLVLGRAVSEGVGPPSDLRV